MKDKIDKRFSHRRLKCVQCNDKITLHYRIPYEDIWECNECGNLRTIDGITPSLYELVGK